MSKVSVIIPAYNCAEYVRKTVDSILAQTYKDVEVIVVNDGSQDETQSILESYGHQIHLINKQNGGVSSARNAGLDAASGDYIMFLDSDDYLDFDCIERAIREGTDIVRFPFLWEYPDGSVVRGKMLFEEETCILKPDFPKYIYPQFLDGINFNSVCGTIFRSGIIGDMRFRTDMKTAEDAVFSVEAYTRANSFVFVPDVFYHYTKSGGGLTGAALSVKEKYRCNYKLSKYMISKLSQWGMNTCLNRFRALFRLVRITLDKIRRG
ncbi:MAG: glycosyltransferase family 2 protein [Clostridia bacterium]|nr:glycosyltransferase family 2 protein [Clostridia bacterium]